MLYKNLNDMINIINVSTRRSKVNYQYRKSFLKFHGTKKKNKDKYNSCLTIQNFFHLTEFCTATTSFNILNPSDVPAKPYPHRGTRAGWWNPLLEFLICCSILKRHYFQWKTFDLLDKMRYNLWVVALLEVCDVTKHGRHLSPHLGFYQELEIR